MRLSLIYTLGLSLNVNVRELCLHLDPLLWVNYMLNDLFRVKDSICDLPPVNSQVNREVSEWLLSEGCERGISPYISWHTALLRELLCWWGERGLTWCFCDTLVGCLLRPLRIKLDHGTREGLLRASHTPGECIWRLLPEHAFSNICINKYMYN